MPETTPNRKPNARLSRWVRNKLPWPHSCISAKTRKVNKLISNTAATVSQRETSTLNTATHQRSARDANVVRTCVNPLTLSDWACRRMMARFCSFMRPIDDTIEHLRFQSILFLLLVGFVLTVRRFAILESGRRSNWIPASARSGRRAGILIVVARRAPTFAGAADELTDKVLDHE